VKLARKPKVVQRKNAGASDDVVRAAIKQKNNLKSTENVSRQLRRATRMSQVLLFESITR
tara:strand:- start:20 stop:199 length:180 start_codon:yes stop_codon:yes gene_type:complete